MSEEETMIERIARHRARQEETPGTWPAKRTLAAALRELLDVLTATEAPSPELLELAESIGQSARRFREHLPPADHPLDPEAMLTGMENFTDRSPMVGLSNAMAPPAVLERDDERKVVRGSVEFGNAFEGGPGLVHGGFCASLLDEALGMACTFSGHPAMTGELTVRYLRPTPILKPLRLEARLDRYEDRKVFVSGELYLEDEACVSAHGLFIAVLFEKFAEFNEARSREG